jgi:hypothetical protein
MTSFVINRLGITMEGIYIICTAEQFKLRSVHYTCLLEALIIQHNLLFQGSL